MYALYVWCTVSNVWYTFTVWWYIYCIITQSVLAADGRDLLPQAHADPASTKSQRPTSRGKRFLWSSTRRGPAQKSPRRAGRRRSAKNGQKKYIFVKQGTRNIKRYNDNKCWREAARDGGGAAANHQRGGRDVRQSRLVWHRMHGAARWGADTPPVVVMLSYICSSGGREGGREGWSEGDSEKIASEREREIDRDL